MPLRPVIFLKQSPTYPLSYPHYIIHTHHGQVYRAWKTMLLSLAICVCGGNTRTRIASFLFPPCLWSFARAQAQCWAMPVLAELITPERDRHAERGSPNRVFTIIKIQEPDKRVTHSPWTVPLSLPFSLLQMFIEYLLCASLVNIFFLGPIVFLNTMISLKRKKK